MPDELAKLMAEHDDWLVVERGLAINSLLAYRRDLRRYASFLRARGETDPAHIGEDVVHAYVRHLETSVDDAGRRTLAASSVARAVVAVRSFHRFCAREGLVERDPSGEVGAPPGPAGIPQAPDVGQARPPPQPGTAADPPAPPHPARHVPLSATPAPTEAPP